CAGRARPPEPSPFSAFRSQYPRLLVEFAHFGERRMMYRPADIIANARQVLHVARLAVANIQTDENAEDLRVSLRSHDCVSGFKARTIEPFAASAHIGIQHLRLEFRRDGHARVLCQRRDIIGRWPDHSVLKIDQAHPAMPFQIAAPDEVRRLVTTKNAALFRGFQSIEGRIPRSSKLLAFRLCSLAPDDMRQIPVRAQLRLDA